MPPVAIPPLVPMPMSTAPTNATPAPIASHFGMPSRRNTPAPSAMRIGPMLTIMAVVPASMDCSAVLSATLYSANQNTPNPMICSHSRRFGRTHFLRPTAKTMPSSTAPTASRPSASAPPEKYGPVPRMTMNALAHARIVTTIAMMTSGVSAEAAGSGAGRSGSGAGLVTLSQ